MKDLIMNHPIVALFIFYGSIGLFCTLVYGFFKFRNWRRITRLRSSSSSRDDDITTVFKRDSLKR